MLSFIIFIKTILIKTDFLINKFKTRVNICIFVALMINSEGKKEIDKPPIPVQIQPHQVKHFKKVLDILSREYGYVDVSPFGAGKTHITFAVAATYKLNMLVIGPKSTLNTWKHWGKIYGVHVIGIMTYQSLRGQSEHVNHNLLEVVNGEYVATELFEQCVQSGLLLVFDEYHNLKNDNTQLASAHALVKSLVRLVRMGHKARIALLSGTPCEVKEYVTSTFKMLGIILSDSLYNYNRSAKKYELIGIQEAIDKCNQYDPDTTLAISCRPVNKTTAKTICYDLYTHVLKRFLVSSMPPPPIDVEKDARNFYALMPDKDVERLKKGILLFKSATNYKHEIQEVDLSGVNWGDVTTSRMEIDSAKIPTVCRLAEMKLLENPKNKVLIYCNYKRDMVMAVNLLSKYNPLMMDGSASEKKRAEINALFQGDNNYRVIISNPKVGGIGIEFDDKVGDSPRFMFVLPSYFFTDQYQATGRIHRIGTKSKATIYFIYSRAFPYETGILNSMANKSHVTRNMVTDEQDNIKFPGEYDELLELTPEEIQTGIVRNMERPLDTIVDDDTNNDEILPYSRTKDLYEKLKNKIGRNDLEEDKYHAYGLFLEEIAKGTEITKGTEIVEADVVRKVCALMDENVRERLSDDMKLLTNPIDVTKYNNEEQMIRFIEAFVM